ncbi:hypothetical protein A3A38_02045 [Candidatus Kaiserbacteria bacterium RIFCSPLOWO2_01_FULL_53_17]|uniref:Serine protease n=1 Tax=Candidatus Kaiserbacteria bacterium RIFCSPLOWO2_01_FULL_53_17 TaxID=1798511 RepID=A0A1F6EFX7_9BACT|nr:MAG: hypothetical protein A3A38_02045 [Candidatus Kaiserbacteria bacterium RIFCSPLOWO2_01_FULL_53_17]
MMFVVLAFLSEDTILDAPDLFYKKQQPNISQAATPVVTLPAETLEEPVLVQETVELPSPSQEEAGKTPQIQDIPSNESFYPFPPASLETLNVNARAALVNILCKTSGGILRPISGSGVIIDPSGVILTNAHVAQYVLLASSQMVDLSCIMRTGSPAMGTWMADVLYIPSAWVAEHAEDIRKTRPLGTGEHDYALLLITGMANGSPLPSVFPYLPVETRSISRVDDRALLAAYPAEFSGGNATQNTLSASSAVTTIKELLTFYENTVDLISFGGVVLAQSGSSGGAVVNEWGLLVGIISTTSDGETTADRDLRAITTSYVNRSLVASTGTTLGEILNKDVTAETAAFMQTKGKVFAQLIVDQLAQ